MALSGTEADIINCVAKLRKASKDQIRREVGFSLDYIGFLCQYLARKGYLNFSQGHYSLAKAGIKTLLTEEPRIDRELIKEVAGEVAKEISGEFKKVIKGISMSVREVAEKEAVKIKTDFELPVEDESLALESNINKIGANLEKEKSNIDKSVELFKKFKKRGKR
jgi:NAD+--asparagine ADP-ribosyltransferase